MALHESGHERLTREIMNRIVGPCLNWGGGHLHDAVVLDNHGRSGRKNFRAIEDSTIYEYAAPHQFSSLCFARIYLL
jgi:hypothetical protein